jgi:uncharacterized protein YyaL (SSP411 family)
VLLRLKEDYDGAEPAASSVSVLNLMTLAHLVDDAVPDTRGFRLQAEERSRQTLAAFASRAGQMGRSVPMMLAALSTYHSGVPQVVVVGEPDGEDTEALKQVLRTGYLPTAIVVTVLPQHREALARLLPWTGAMKEVNGRATAYVCRDFACQAPATSPAELEKQLRGVRL